MSRPNGRNAIIGKAYNSVACLTLFGFAKTSVACLTLFGFAETSVACRNKCRWDK